MSISLYYTARRSQPITSQEQCNCAEIAKRYDQQYPFGELYEGFYIYNLEKFEDVKEENIIFDGSTKLPTDIDGEFLLNVVDWWLKCLEEIAGVLVGAQWNVHLDDIVNFKWVEAEHGFFPDIEC